MNVLTLDKVQALLSPYVEAPLPESALEKVLRYLSVFEVWSRRVSLSTVTAPEQVVQRHFGEGFALAQALPPFTTALDLGSGAGFPGIPLALAHPRARVTLAESQHRKAAFLQEVTSAMGLPVQVWAQRAESFPLGTSFDVVALRAVDNMPSALRAGARLLSSGGTLAFFAGEQEAIDLPVGNWEAVQSLKTPNSPGQLILAKSAT